MGWGEYNRVHIGMSYHRVIKTPNTRLTRNIK